MSSTGERKRTALDACWGTNRFWQADPVDTDAYQRLLQERQNFFIPFYLQVIDEHPFGIEARDVKRAVFEHLNERYGIDVVDPTVIPPNPSTGRTQADQWANNLVSNRVLDDLCFVDRSGWSVVLYPDASNIDDKGADELTATEVPVEVMHTERFERHGEAGLTPADRAEAALVASFISSVDAAFVRYRIDVPGEPWPLFTDLYDPYNNTLIEAKASASRHDIRSAIGQLFDYSRFLASPQLAILVPEYPRPDLEQLLEDVGIRLIVHDSGW
jgi:hypothetical protein